MSRKLGRFFLVLVSVLVVLGVLGALIAPPLTRKVAKNSFPKIDGEIKLVGLDGPVDVFRDSSGVPHIYATTQHDLFYTQGYVHAQDRFWQMDFWRHQGAGRLSELLGSTTLETDKFLRTVGWERVARAELANLDADSRAILDAYSKGVNAYLADHEGSDMSLEYAFLPILNRGYKPAPWTPLNTLTWTKAMAWDLRGNMDSEIDRALLLKELTSQQVDFLFPSYPEDRPVIVGEPHITTGSLSPSGPSAGIASAASPALLALRGQLDRMDILTGGGFEGIGSNSWVLSGDLTATGMPLLANDPHLAAMLPSIWYEVGLHCLPKGPNCQIDVSGFSFASAPGIVIGHNERIAWGFTNVGPDVMDLYIEKINPSNPDQYEYEGQWVDMEVIQEKIQVANGENQDIAVRLTRHGPLITDVYGLTDLAEQSGLSLPDNYAIALRWTALETSCVFCAIWEFNKAENFEAFRSAASKFAVPSQNLIYVDVDGNIGYQMPGNIPIRSEGHDGMLPVPGWTGEYEWQGYIPFDELPFAFNPPEGYIVTANNAVVGPEYPYSISRQWALGFRAQRIVDMIQDAPGAISVADIQAMQGDNKDLLAEVLVPILLGISLNDTNLEEARGELKGWDYQMHMDSAPAALYAAFWKQLLKVTFEDDLPEFYYPGGGGGWMEITRQLVDDPGSVWWDESTTAEKETRDDMFRRALAAAVDELEDTLGKDQAKWAWGDLHTITFYNQVMSSFPLVNTAFNRGPFRTSGGSAIVNATGWSSTGTYEVNWVPSMRMIVDTSSLQDSLVMHTTGQSGHAYHTHYIDMPDPWRQVRYHPMHWDRSSVEADAEGHLRLIP